MDALFTGILEACFATDCPLAQYGDVDGVLSALKTFFETLIAQLPQEGFSSADINAMKWMLAKPMYSPASYGALLNTIAAWLEIGENITWEMAMELIRLALPPSEEPRLWDLSEPGTPSSPSDAATTQQGPPTLPSSKTGTHPSPKSARG